MSGRHRAGQIIVLAGTNGAGKSSVAGAALRQSGAEYFNPDEATRRILEHRPALSLAEANSLAWWWGHDRLAEAIARRLQFAFETTLGGSTLTTLLLGAARTGTAVRVWYVGLASVEQHLARVRARVARGGHDIPEDRIRARYDSSRKNLIRLLPYLAELKLYDNSAEHDPADGHPPQPALILHARSRGIVDTRAAVDVPDWAKPILQAALALRASA